MPAILTINAGMPDMCVHITRHKYFYIIAI